MRGLFDALDAGQYDAWLLVAMGVILFLSFSAGSFIRRNAGRRFKQDQARAQELWSRYGADHQTTKVAVIEALASWHVWQGRSPLDLDPNNPGTREADWDAISLMRSVPEGSFNLVA